MSTRTGRRLLSLFVLLALASPELKAEENASEASPPSEPIVELSTTVRASSQPTSASEHTVEGSLVNATAKSSAGEALRLVPGLVVSQHGGEGKAHQIFLRGYDAMHGQDVEVEVAGAPVNAVSHIHALGYADLGFVIPELIGELSSLEGPYRVDQGDYALAGTVRLSLAAPGSGLFGSLGVGQHDRQRLMAAYGASDPRTFVGLELARGTGLGPSRAFERATLLAQGRRTLGPLLLRASGGAHATRFETPGVLREDDLHSGAVDFFGSYDPHQGGSGQRLHALLDLGTRDEETGLLLHAARQTLRLKQNYTGFWFDPRGDGLEQANAATTLGLKLRHAERGRLGPLRLRGEFGAGLRHDLVDQSQRGYLHDDGSLFDDTDRSLSLSLGQTHFFGYARALARRSGWRFTLGLRADGLATELEDQRVGALVKERRALGGKLGLEASLARQLGDRMLVSLQYGDGFRSPHAQSLADGERTPFVAVRGGELGWRWDSEKLTASTALFSSWVENDVFFDPTVSSSILLGPTVRSGLSAALTARPRESLTLVASGTAAHAFLTKSRTLMPGFVPFAGRFDGLWRRSLPRGFSLQTGASLTAVGPRPLRFGESGSSYLLADARVSLAHRRVALRLDLQNLFNARWRDGEFSYPSNFPGNSIDATLPARHFTSGTPRTATLTLELLPESSL